MDQNLIDYIKSVKKKGFDDKKIKEHLSNYGYSKQDIDSAYKALGPIINELKPLQEEKPKKSFPLIPIFITIIIILLVIGGYFYIQKQSQKCNNISVGIYHIKGEPVLCVYPNNAKLQMILENTGDEVIPAVEIEIKGERRITANLDNIFLMPGNIYTKTLEYSPDNGDITEISIIPIADTKCGGITIKDIKTC